MSHAATRDSLARPGFPIRALLASARPRQWTKNLIVFGPLIFAYRLLAPSQALEAAATFVAFCLVSSATYLVNDVVDLRNDRQHPAKRFRPLAAGKISTGQALAGALVLAILAVACGLAARPVVGLAAAGYLALMLAYSAWLKHLVILDAFAIAGGFIIRAVAGAIAIGVIISPWLYLCTMLLALFLALSKRQNELLVLDEGAAGHRRSLEEYSPQLLEQMTSVVTASTIMAYSLYTFSADSLPANHAMMLTIPFVIYGIFRYQYLVHKKNLGGAPELILLRDRPIMLDILLWGLTAIAVLYVFR
ncbi:MAG: decaprenyl-phosphate phosphoribosyltransferase [Chloroflexota bacterium]